MAEALQLESFNSKYFCHHCTREVGPFHTAELICPGCSSDFLEVVSKEFYEAENMPSLCDDYESSSENEAESDDLFMPELSMERLLSRMLLNVAESLPPETSEPEEPDPIVNASEQGERLFRTESYSEIVMDVGGIHDVLNNSDMEVTHIRDFEEYNVDEEIDALASQLLDEIEVSGPPPLTKEQIKSLLTVKMTKDHIEMGLQCTVCMEDLKLQDKAKQLPCNHYYHEKCISPWLERQSTCPNCREVIQVKSKSKGSKRSKSCPRARMNLRNGDSRRFSEATSLSDFFTTSMNPFRFIN